MCLFKGTSSLVAQEIGEGATVAGTVLNAASKFIQDPMGAIQALAGSTTEDETAASISRTAQPATIQDLQSANAPQMTTVYDAMPNTNPAVPESEQMVQRQHMGILDLAEPVIENILDQIIKALPDPEVPMEESPVDVALDLMDVNGLVRTSQQLMPDDDYNYNKYKNLKLNLVQDVSWIGKLI